MISISYRDHFRGDSSFNPVSFLKIPEFREHYKRIQQEIREKIENSPEAREVVNRKFLDEMRGEIEKVMDRYLKNQPNVRIPLDSLIDEATLGVQSSYARHVLKA